MDLCQRALLLLAGANPPPSACVARFRSHRTPQGVPRAMVSQISKGVEKVSREMGPGALQNNKAKL